jgi:aromatic cluster surface protein
MSTKKLTTIALILLSLILISCSKDKKTTNSNSHKPAASHTVHFESQAEYEQYLEDEYNSYISDQMYYEDEIKARWH